MPTRRDFLRQSALGVGTLACSPTLAVPASGLLDSIPRRFIFIRNWSRTASIWPSCRGFRPR
jgi:hypothetical protein